MEKNSNVIDRWRSFKNAPNANETCFLLAYLGFTYFKDLQSCVCVHCGWKSSKETQFKFVQYEHLKNSKCLINVKIVSADIDTKYTDRLKSFNSQNWPTNLDSLKESLAEAGFRYINVKDYVKCDECKSILNEWSVLDIPIVEHYLIKSDCPFVLVKFQNFQKYINSVVYSSKKMLYEPFVEFRQAKHIEYSTYQNRFSSFLNLKDKQILPPGQNIETLAEAGFFFVGPVDNVKCFCCDGGLKNWRYDDDPWVEHKKWFPNCLFLKTRNSEKQFKKAQLKRNNMLEMDKNYNAADKQNVEQREIKARMDRPHVQMVIQMGFSRELVKKLIETRLQYKGEDFTTVKGIVEALLKIINKTQENGLSNTDYEKPSKNGVSTNIISNSAESIYSITSENKHKDNSLSYSSNCSNLSFDETEEGYIALMEENKRLKDARMCKVCLDREVNIVFLPCGHLVCCEFCAPELRNCAICRSLIRGTVKAFI